MTLDKMETVEGILDEKNITLLSAIYTAVSSDHKKLNVLATVMSNFKEMKTIFERIISEMLIIRDKFHSILNYVCW